MPQLCGGLTVNCRRVASPEGKRPLGRPESMWKDKIKMNLGEIG
jgi:hypothetical protein